MKKILDYFFEWIEAVGRARAATYHTRRGDHETARKIMSK